MSAVLQMPRSQLLMLPALHRPAGAPAPRAGLAACAFCGKLAPAGQLRTCGSCKRVAYCSRSCQVKDWKQGGHKEVCVAAEGAAGGQAAAGAAAAGAAAAAIEPAAAGPEEAQE